MIYRYNVLREYVEAEDFDGDEEWYSPFADAGRYRYYYDEDYDGEGPF